jgi:hypothetical protein
MQVIYLLGGSPFFLESVSASEKALPGESSPSGAMTSAFLIALILSLGRHGCAKIFFFRLSHWIVSLTTSWYTSPTCSKPLPSKPSLGAVEPSPDTAMVPESVATLRGRRFCVPCGVPPLALVIDLSALLS